MTRLHEVRPLLPATAFAQSYKGFTIAAITMLLLLTTATPSSTVDAHPVNSSIKRGLVLDLLRLRNGGGGRGHHHPQPPTSSPSWLSSFNNKQGATTATKSSTSNIDRLVSELKQKYKQLKKENEELCHICCSKQK